MTEPADIYRSAWTMLRHYGADAPAEAERRGRDMDDAGDSEGAVFWQRVEAAIGELVDHRAKKERSDGGRGTSRLRTTTASDAPRGRLERFRPGARAPGRGR